MAQLRGLPRNTAVQARVSRNLAHLSTFHGCAFKEGYDPSDPSTCEEWTDLVDRGGLWHLRETTFQLLCALEEEIRTHLDALSSPNAAGLWTQFVERLIKSEDGQFYWCITMADFEVDDVEVHDHLLMMIVELFVTIRGFSYASAWIEHYKQSQKCVYHR